MVKDAAKDQEKESSPCSDSGSSERVPTTPLFESSSFIQKEGFKEDGVQNEDDLVEA